MTIRKRNQHHVTATRKHTVHLLPSIIQKIAPPFLYVIHITKNMVLTVKLLLLYQKKKKIQSSESVYSTQTINEEEKEEPTKEISTKKRKQIKIQTSKKQIKIKTPKKKVSHSHEIIKK